MASNMQARPFDGPSGFSYAPPTAYMTTRSAYQTGAEGMGGLDARPQFQQPPLQQPPQQQPFSLSSAPSQTRVGAAVAPTNGIEANPNLYVHNVPKDSNEDELRSLFGQYGTVERVRLKVNTRVGPHAVYAFVTFSSTAEAQLALQNLQGTDVRGRSLRIEFQRTNNNSTTGGPSSPHNPPMAVTPHQMRFDHMGGGPGGVSTPVASEASLTLPSSPSAFTATPTSIFSGDSRLAMPPAGGDMMHHAGFQRQERHTASQPTPPAWAGAPPGDWAAGTPLMQTLRHGRDPSSDYMPPQKRGRFHSPATTNQRSPTQENPALNMIHEDDLPSLLMSLRNIVAATRPEGLELVYQLSQMLLGSETALDRFAVQPQPQMWPSAELTQAQQQLVRNGTMSLDHDTNRWRLKLTNMLEPLKPVLYARRASLQQQTQKPVVMQPQVYEPPSQHQPPSLMQMSQPQHQSMPPMMVQASMPAVGGFVEESSPNAAWTNFTAAPPAVPAKPDTPFMPPTSATMDTNTGDDAGSWSRRLSRLEVTKPEERTIIWNGILARNDKKKLPVVMRRLAGQIDQFLPPKASTLNISHRSALDEMFKKELGAVGLLEASSPEGARSFQEYINYFQEKNRAGVVRLDRPDYQIIYLIPVGVPGVAEAMGCVLSPSTPDCLLAILGRQSQVVPEITEVSQRLEDNSVTVPLAPPTASEILSAPTGTEQPCTVANQESDGIDSLAAPTQATAETGILE